MKITNQAVKQIKIDFPILNKKFNNNQLTYLDNAATTQKPQKVLNQIKKFYENSNANPHRGLYFLSEIATQQYEDARKKVAQFINAQPKEIIFTKNTTESINLLSHTIKSLISNNEKN